MTNFIVVVQIESKRHNGQHNQHRTNTKVRGHSTRISRRIFRSHHNTINSWRQYIMMKKIQDKEKC